jgi:outer membrane receptor protein involved in Fe transport
MRKQSYVLPVLAVTVSMLSVSTAMAQESSKGGGLETITVTARKMTESLQDVPVAVTAITQSALKNNVANSLENIAELAPQVSIGKATTGTGALITIRGISSAGVDAGLDQSVTMDVDGVALSRGRIVQTSTFDLASVQILEGPQALFFGKNSPAGVIVLNSAEPTSNYEGSVKIGHEFEAEENYVEGLISGPITDSLKGRAAIRYDHTNGWIHNIATAQPNPFNPAVPLPGATNGQDIAPTSRDLTGRISLTYDPGDDFTAKLKVTINDEHTNGNASFSDTFCTAGAQPNILGVPATHFNCAGDRVQWISNLPPQYAVNYPYGNGGVPYERSNLGLGSLILDKKFGDISVTSTTGYYSQAVKGSFVGDFSEFATIYDSEAERFHQFNQELRVNTDFAGPVNGMVGGYYEHGTRHWFNSHDLLNIYNTVAGNYTSFMTYSDSKTENYSFFGQLRWKIVPTVELAGGVRWSHDSKNSTYVNQGGNPAEPALGIFLRPDGVPMSAHYSGDNASPEGTITWKPTPDQTVYAAYKTGYKSGGLSNGALLTLATTPDSVVFGPEKTHGFEIGYKATLLNNTLRFDAVGYRYNYNGLQVTTLVPPTYTPNIKNAAAARTYGIETNATWLAMERLSFNGYFSWNHARYTSFPNAQCWSGQTPATGCVNNVQDLTGRPLQRAPNITFKLGTDYKADLPGGYVADLSLSGAYTSSMLTATDYSPGGPQSAYWLLNAAIHVTPENNKFEVSLVGRNLTNSFYRLDTHSSGISVPYQNQYNGFYNRPREIVLELQYNFF